jgi:hypothetical protein
MEITAKTDAPTRARTIDNFFIIALLPRRLVGSAVLTVGGKTSSDLGYVTKVDKIGRRLRGENLIRLLREMERTPGCGQCNHGRSTYVELKLADVEKLFGRR